MLGCRHDILPHSASRWALKVIPRFAGSLDLGDVGGTVVSHKQLRGISSRGFLVYRAIRHRLHMSSGLAPANLRDSPSIGPSTPMAATRQSLRQRRA